MSSPTRSGFTRRSRAIETTTIFHVAVMFAFTAWAFGGMIDWARQALTLWGSLSVGLIYVEIVRRKSAGDSIRELHWLWPLAAFNAIAVAAAFNPSYDEILMEGRRMVRRIAETPHLPTTVGAEISLQALWTFNAICLSAFNLAFVIRKRSLLRRLLGFMLVNVLVLALFGTAQNLLGVSGIYFGAVTTVQPYFFASFVYHNHWAAFTLLLIGGCIGLVWHLVRQRESRDVLHSPLLAGCVALLILAVTLPLSGSRSGTLSLIVFAGVALADILRAIIKRRRQMRESVIPPLAIAAVAVGAAAFTVYDVARPMIERRLGHTQKQVAAARTHGDLGARPALYRDTWEMAKAKILFGWGMNSYPIAFQQFNSTPAAETWARYWRGPIFYHDAHSDWLQTLAEHGVIGTALLLLIAIIPAIHARRELAGILPRYLLLGCGLVAAYSALEFPFGNLAVVLTWWILFFMAVSYARLSAK